MSFTQVATNGTPRQLDPRVVAFDRVIGWIVTGSVSISILLGILVAWIATSPPGWVWDVCGFVWVVVTASLAWLGQVWPERAYQATSYLVDDVGIEIRRGVYWRAIVVVPRSRVQHIDVLQGPLRRSYGLAVLVIFTAGTEHSSVSLPGLAHPTALALRDLLLPESPHDGV